MIHWLTSAPDFGFRCVAAALILLWGGAAHYLLAKGKL